jgi:anti-sigma-K factor RskA
MSIDEPNTRGEGCGGNAAPYVLGALTEQEHELFRSHLESCAVCREEVAALQLVADALPAAAPQLGAPPELKRRVMSSVRADARRRGGSEAARPSGSGHRAAAAERRVLRLAGPGWPRWRPNLAVAALAAALVALAVVALSSGAGTSGGTRVIRAQVSVPRASASLSVSNGHAQLSLLGMPQAPPGRVYELWLKRSSSGEPQPTDALFTVAAGGAASVGVPGSVDGVTEIMVTSEPLGGSRVPTPPVLILARLS